MHIAIELFAIHTNCRNVQATVTTKVFELVIIDS